MTSTRRYFDKQAQAFDRRYARPTLATRLLRSGPWRGRELAVSVVSRHPHASVLDVGCGPGRVGEAVLAGGAATYVGIDLSSRMLALARERLAGFKSVELLEGDFLGLELPRTFDVVLALGLFDYLEHRARAAEWLLARCSSTLVASFTCRDRVKAPMRHVHYELLRRVPISDYTEAEAEALLTQAGFSDVDFASTGRRGFMVTAKVR